MHLFSVTLDQNFTIYLMALFLRRKIQSFAARSATTAPVASKLSGLALLAASSVAVVYQYDYKTSSARCAALPVQGVPGTNRERTFLAVKPDGVQRGLIGDIIARFEKRGYKVRLGDTDCDKSQSRSFYVHQLTRVHFSLRQSLLA